MLFVDSVTRERMVLSHIASLINTIQQFSAHTVQKDDKLINVDSLIINNNNNYQ